MKEFLDIWAQSTEMKKMLKFGVGITITHQKKYIYHYHIPKVLSTGGGALVTRANQANTL